MAKPRAILKHVNAIKGIAKITKTMELIARARFKTAFDRAVAARPYTDRLGRLLAELRGAAGEAFRHPLLEVRPARAAVVFAVASNRGLCGGYNGGVGRELVRLVGELRERGVAFELLVSGKRLGTWLRYQSVAVDRLVTHLDDRPSFAAVDALVSPVLERFAAGTVDEVHVVYTKFLSASQQRSVSERVLPLDAPAAAEGGAEGVGRDWIFSPDPASILADLLPRRVRLHVFQAFLDAAASEQTARMVAMKAATDNAEDLITELTRKYNRSRQSQITTELNEIMGGAAALE
jgi:F-type H+-transporting ATPase subunit gamma